MSEKSPSLTLPAAAYDRVSTFKQLGSRFTSCEAQAQVCTEFIKQHANEGWYLEDHFSDPAYSGKNLERPGMKAMKDAIASGRIKIVVAYKIERLLRSTDEWPEFRAFLKKHNCRLVSVSEGFAEDTAAGRFRTNMMVAQSAYERENTSEKVKNKEYLQAQRGFWRGGYDCFGYNNDKTEKLLVLNAKEELIVRRVYEQAARLVPLTEIAEMLNADGIRTRVRTLKSRDGEVRTVGGVRVRSDWLRLMICNPIYKGVVKCRGEEFKGRHQAIVDSELWSTANAAIRQTLKPARCNQPRRDRHFNILKGLIFCGECSRAMVPHASGKRSKERAPYRYYTCDKVLRERGDASCLVRRVSGPAIESCVVGILGQMAQRPEVLEAALAAGRGNNQKQKEEWEKKLRRANSELSQINQQVGNLIDALAKEELKELSGDLRDRVKQLASRKDVVLVERERLQLEIEVVRQEDLAPSRLSEALGKFDSLWANMTAEEKKELVNLAVARVSVRANRQSGGDTDSAQVRSLQLSVKLHLPELLAASGTTLGNRKTKFFTFETSVQIPANGMGEVQITAPFKHCVGRSGKMAPAVNRSTKQEHPLERAIRWTQILESKAQLTARALAKQVGVSEATMSMTLALMGLSPAVREYILSNRDHRAVRHMGLRMLGALSGKSPAEQQAAVTAMMSRWA